MGALPWTCGTERDSPLSASTAHVHPYNASAAREEIVTSVRQALHQDGRGPAVRPEIVDELAVHACAVLADVIAAVEGGGPLDVIPPGGGGWPRPGMDWAQLLRMGTTLFEVLLPIALRELAPPDDAAVTRISVLLHQGITARVVRDPLVRPLPPSDLVLASRRDERRRMTRELHDQVLHGMGLALQSLDLHRYHAETSPALARDKVDRAIGLLRQVMSTLQQFSVELRRSVEPGGLERALRSYLAVHVEPSVDVVIRTRGDLTSLPAEVGEEVYLIVREAVRNAVCHASPSRLHVAVEVGGGTVRATVTDDGVGFDPGVSPAGGGLSSMQERAMLLRGQFTWSSVPGVGTRVELRIPLAGGDQ